MRNIVTFLDIFSVMRLPNPAFLPWKINKAILAIIFLTQNLSRFDRFSKAVTNSQNTVAFFSLILYQENPVCEVIAHPVVVTQRFQSRYAL